MNRKEILHLGVASTFLCAACIIVADRYIALFAESLPDSVPTFFQRGTELLEIVFLWGISKYALGFLLFAAGVGMWIKKSWRKVGNLFLLISLSHMLSRLIAGILKNVFGRLRPFEILESGNWNSQFFEGGGSLPSGHTAHFWGLFLPLMIAFPRFRIPLMIIPIFISLARVVVNDHFFGDVLASLALSAFITYGIIKLFYSKETLHPYYLVNEIKAPENLQK